jgi:hypothetical protein
MVYAVTALLESPANLEVFGKGDQNKNQLTSMSKEAKESINLSRNTVAAK